MGDPRTASSQDPAAQPLAAISVDLDEVDCYTAIHGMAPPSARAAHAVYQKALPRFETLFAELEIPATFFVIGRDLATPENHARIGRLWRAGHEIGNHSANHLYDLTRRDMPTMRREIERGASAIAEITGHLPSGFRAPGYTVSDTLFELLEESGTGYDSSVFACPAYYGAKAAALGGMRLVGKRSHSILDDPRVLLARADPYRVGRPYWRGGRGLLELPIGVTRELAGRLPYIGTSLILAGARGTRWLTRLISGRPLVNLELHGIDLADADRDDLSALRPHQPDLRFPLARKVACLRAAVETLRERGYRFVTLEQAASHWSGDR